MMKKNKIKPVKIDSMLYIKTNEDFNNEKPNLQDPTQIKVHPIDENEIIHPLIKFLKTQNYELDYNNCSNHFCNCNCCFYNNSQPERQN